MILRICMCVMNEWINTAIAILTIIQTFIDPAAILLILFIV